MPSLFLLLHIGTTGERVQLASLRATHDIPARATSARELWTVTSKLTDYMLQQHVSKRTGRFVRSILYECREASGR